MTAKEHALTICNPAVLELDKAAVSPLKNFGDASLHPREFRSIVLKRLISSSLQPFSLQPCYISSQSQLIFRQHCWRSASSVLMYRDCGSSCQEESALWRAENEKSGSTCERNESGLRRSATRMRHVDVARTGARITFSSLLSGADSEAAPSVHQLGSAPVRDSLGPVLRRFQTKGRFGIAPGRDGCTAKIAEGVPPRERMANVGLSACI